MNRTERQDNEHRIISSFKKELKSNGIKLICVDKNVIIENCGRLHTAGFRLVHGENHLSGNKKTIAKISSIVTHKICWGYFIIDPIEIDDKSGHAVSLFFTTKNPFKIEKQ